MKEKLYSIFTHIYARDVKRKKGEDHTYCYASSFEHYLLHLVYVASLPLLTEKIASDLTV